MTTSLGYTLNYASYLLDAPQNHPRTVVLAVCGALALSSAQQASFEVASIKQLDTTLPSRVRGVSCRGVDGAVGHPLLVARTVHDA